MLALSIVEGFARGWAYLHTAQLPVPKNLAAKPRISITSKLIERKRLQVLYFGHLRKTGGRGSYRLVHTTYLYLRKPHGSKFNHSRTLVPSAFREGYATPRGWGGISWSNLQVSLEMPARRLCGVSARRHFLPQRAFFDFRPLATGRRPLVAAYFGMTSRASLLITTSRRSLRFRPASSMASREP
jgi:hypothetical protein